MKHTKILGAAFFLMAVGLPVNSRAAQGLGSVGLGFQFTSGDYRTGTTTDTVFVPLTVDLTPTARWDVSLEIPWVYQSNTNVIAGQFRQMQGMTAAKTVAAMGSTGSGSMGGTGLRSGSNTDPGRSQNGVGDITLKTGYAILTETDGLPLVRPNVFVKIPTADKDRGLGTGEFDEGVAVEFSKSWGKWFAVAEPGYVIQGKAPDLALKNYFMCKTGAGYQFTDDLSSMVLVKASTALAEGETAVVETRLRTQYMFTDHTGIDGYVAKGVTASSPDYGAGFGVFYNF